MRDEVFVRVAALAGLTNSLAKIAQDIAELGSTEIGEVAEPHAGGKDTSSTLPLKANPILCAHTVAAATLVGQNAMSVLLAGRQRQERSGEALLELARGEADVAIRSGKPKDPELIGRRLRDTPARRRPASDCVACSHGARTRAVAPAHARSAGCARPAR